MSFLRRPTPCHGSGSSSTRYSLSTKMKPPDEALNAAAEGGKNNPYLSGMSAFYRALSLFRQGKEAEADGQHDEVHHGMLLEPGGTAH